MNFSILLSGVYCSAELSPTIMRFLYKLCAYSLETMHWSVSLNSELKTEWLFA